MATLESKGIVTLKKGEGRSLKAGSAWVYDNEISDVSGEIENGDIITLHDFDGYFMGYGFINLNSKIRVRMLSRYRKEPLDTAFLEKRAKAAWEYRKSVVDTSSCRVIFGEADFLPGLTVDKYEDLLVFECLSLGMDKLKDIVLMGLVKAMEEDDVIINGIFERSDANVRKKEGMPKVKGWFWTRDNREMSPLVQITENGVKYTVDIENGQKTGFFLDQKVNRRHIQELISNMKSQGQLTKTLDCFTHMGTFALNMGLAGADSVTGLDISALAVEEASANAKLNGLSDTVKFKEVDVFDELPRLIQEGEKYDVVILDPPAFTKSREATKKAITGYREINIRGLKLVREGGYLATCSCSHFMTQPLFEKMMREAARSAHKRIRQVLFSTQAPDHPILIDGSENSYYLKFYIFQVVEEK
ncbi:MAG: class I SAM-dependent rRNA methyltransferase [Lachnospiraceae bacterium]|nr:class I SAM-dependent rRNA methyltransferase [Lachnospiraceae bacterium]